MAQTITTGQDINLDYVRDLVLSLDTTLDLDLDTLIELGFWNSYKALALGRTDLNTMFLTIKDLPKSKLVLTLQEVLTLVISFIYSRNTANLKLGLELVMTTLTKLGRVYSIECISKYLSPVVFAAN